MPHPEHLHPTPPPSLLNPVFPGRPRLEPALEPCSSILRKRRAGSKEAWDCPETEELLMEAVHHCDSVSQSSTPLASRRCVTCPPSPPREGGEGGQLCSNDSGIGCSASLEQLAVTSLWGLQGSSGDSRGFSARTSAGETGDPVAGTSVGDTKGPSADTSSGDTKGPTS